MPAQAPASAGESERAEPEATVQADAETAGCEAEDAPAAFRFQVQPEFHPVPLGTDDDEEAFDEQMREFARDYWGDREELEPLRRFTAAMYGVNSQQLAAEGTVYHALGIFPIGGTVEGAQSPERVSRCTLSVSVRDLDNPAPHLAAAGIAETLDKGQESGEVQLITLPAGPAVVHIAGSRAVWELPDGEDQERFFVRIEVWMPFPEDDRLLLLCLSTADVQDLYHYQAVLADIADTITFGDAEADLAAVGGTEPQAHPFG
ncbi:hypothetical protein [Streptomyces sp. AS02]|uniref:hypothetical protein n=1 Tax=Streptomyces sp. AS02 TaxID=2938946 RepID=UPI0020216BB1|nr:hypothetical protein [Streptomyces sp. AS02]MCL8016815.1 hypothetical protein [Streptomyces sp. AS02]